MKADGKTNEIQKWQQFQLKRKLETEMEKFITWICCECGQIVSATERPDLAWSDGHICVFIEKQEME